MPEPPTVLTERVVSICGSQDGVISRFQLREAGFSDRGVDGRNRRGQLFRVYHGTYSTTKEIDRRALWRAGVLASGQSAVLSHMSAAALWGFAKASGPTEVTRRSSRGRHRSVMPPSSTPVLGRAKLAGHSRLPILRIHVTRRIEDFEMTTRQGIPVTTVARTFVDIAGSVGKGQLKKLLHEASRNQLLDLDELWQVMRRARGKRGIGKIRQILEDWDPQTGLTRNALEKLMLDLCRSHRIPVPLANRTVAGYEVDFFWPEHGLIVETDGGRDHSAPYGLERDRERDSDLQLKGFLILRLTWSMLKREPERSMRKVRAHLAMCERQRRRTEPGWGSASQNSE
ncbi:MAG: DUF559 domain-containing protein [Solirubrobacterales bacterium]|nr:DUF559 domain-containing protein [Solirubrobacterales bacterium]